MRKFLRVCGVIALMTVLTFACWEVAYGLNAPTGFDMQVPATTANSLTSIRVRFTVLDSINRANGDSVTIRNASDSSIVFQFGYDASLFTVSKDTTFTGLKPRTTYIWFVSVDSATVRKRSSTTDTLATTWIGVENPQRLNGLLTMLDEPMRSATSIVPGILSSPMSKMTVTFDTTTVTLHGAADTESTMVYEPWMYNGIRLVSTVADSARYTAFACVGDADSTTGWSFEIVDSLTVTTPGTHVFSPKIPVTSNFYIRYRGDTGAKKVLPIKAFLNRDRH